MNSTPDPQANGANSSAEPFASPFTLVGLGASAGGIRALQSFFETLPAESGMAFVVVMHLLPNHQSSLAQLLQARTAMPVLQVTERTSLLPDHVYVIPPNKHLILQANDIDLIDPQQAAGKRLAIDLFFRNLAALYGPRAVAVVLSGTDSDGSIGIKHIKEQGGVTLAQEPTEAEYDSMPRSAIRTGMVDWVLPVAQMPARLLDFMRNEARMHIPPEEPQSVADAQAEDHNSGGTPAVRKVASVGDEEALIEVLRFVRTQTGHDFIHYKRATILRRVARRMQVNLLEDIPSYLVFLQTYPEEAIALLRDLLISVTNFFRDPEAFAALESHIPQLFADKAVGDQVRVWVAGCATGEEAYSVAMLLSEYAERLETPPAIRVFATDLDDNAIQIARAGLYPPTIEADVSPERLQRFFYREDAGYRVKRELREQVLFSVHNLLKDSPFSRLDLVTCRNLLIYLKREAQDRVFDLFHFALRAGGLLLLGSAESIFDGHVQFAPLDRPQRLFVRRSIPRASWQLPALPVAPVAESHSVAPPTPLPTLPAAEFAPNPPRTPPSTALEERGTSSFGDLHLNLLEQLAPPSLVVNENYDIVHLSEHVGRFLQFAGELSHNLLQVVHPTLRLELQTALFRATYQQEKVSTSAMPFELEGSRRSVTIHVHPSHPEGIGAAFLLVVFETTDAVSGVPEPAAMLPHAMTQHLQVEIQYLRQQLSARGEQYEASLEELKAAAEEQQSINEEMRSTTEELETSKEELQSTNEELTTVNQELKSNVDELSRANGDLQNLMASTEIGTIFLDRELRIKRYTPRIRDLFNIIPTDIGRPLDDLNHKLSRHSFTRDAEQVLQTLASSEREVRTDGHYFLARMLPYRTPEDYIDGVVLTFIDITERKKAEEALAASEQKYHTLFNSIDEGFCTIEVLFNESGQCTDYRFLDVNPSFERQTGLKNAIGRRMRELAPEHEAFWFETYGRIALTGEAERFEHAAAALGKFYDVYAFRIGEAWENRLAILFQDITARRRTEEQRRELERETVLLTERNRMAQELHDTLAQGFTGIKLQIDVAESALLATPTETDEALARLRRAREMALQSHLEARRSIRSLRSPLLDNISLVEAFEQMAQQAMDGITVTFTVEGEPFPLSGLVENDLYRIGQEALTNALQHSRARHITLTLDYEETTVRLTILDDGRGFEPLSNRAGFGVTGMQERAIRLGSTLQIESRPGEGTRVALHFRPPVH